MLPESLHHLLAELPAPGAALPPAVAEARLAFVAACRPHFGQPAVAWPWPALRPLLDAYLRSYADAATVATGQVARALQELDLLLVRDAPTGEPPCLLRPPVHPLHAAWLADAHPAPLPCPLVLPRSRGDLYHCHDQPAPGWALYVPDGCLLPLPAWAHAEAGARLAEALAAAVDRLSLPSPLTLAVLTRSDPGSVTAALNRLAAAPRSAAWRWHLQLVVSEEWEDRAPPALPPLPVVLSCQCLSWQDYLAAPPAADLAVALDLTAPRAACCARPALPQPWPVVGAAPGAGTGDLRWHFAPPGAVAAPATAAALSAHQEMTLRQLTRRHGAAVPGIAASLAPAAKALLTTAMQQVGLVVLADPWLPPALLDRPADSTRPPLLTLPAQVGRPWTAVRPPEAAWAPLAAALRQLGLTGPLASWQALLRAVAPDATLRHLTAPAPLPPLLVAARLALAAPRPLLPVTDSATGLLGWLDLEQWPTRLGLYPVLLEGQEPDAVLTAWRERYAPGRDPLATVRLRHWLADALLRAERHRLLPAAHRRAAEANLARLPLAAPLELRPRRLRLAPTSPTPFFVTDELGLPTATLGAPALADLGHADRELAQRLTAAWRESPPVLAYRRPAPTSLLRAAEPRAEYRPEPPPDATQ